MTSKHTMSGVKVKPLEWEYPTDATNGCHVARCAFGTYSAVNEQGWYVTLDEHPWGQGFEWTAPDMRMTFEDAKAAAQADYEARILAALAPSDAEPPHPDSSSEAVREAAIRNAARPIIDELAERFSESEGTVDDYADYMNRIPDAVVAALKSINGGVTK